MSAGIHAYGGYIPKARLQRSEIAKSHTWFTPGLRGLGKGERSMANWDEDSVTMAVEAGRDCLRDTDRGQIAGMYLASTTFPFLDRQNAGIVAEALNLKTDIQAIDLGSSQRAGSSSLMVALQCTESIGSILVAGGEKRRTKAANPLEFTTGDGAAALVPGNRGSRARRVRTDRVSRCGNHQHT